MRLAYFCLFWCLEHIYEVKKLLSNPVRPHRWQPTKLASLGFSRQEYWSGLLFPSPVRESEIAQSCTTLTTPWTVAYQAPLAMGFPRQEHWSGVPGILQRAGCPLLFVKFPETFWKGFLGGKPPGLLGRRQARSWTPGLL